jgi:NAD(P)-dependent dehydrogenase (short-subunit alcohol dehydrogenase family)
MIPLQSPHLIGKSRLTAFPGRSLAIKFSKTYPVVLISRASASYVDIVSEINTTGGKAIGVDADVADRASLEKAFEAIKDEFGDAQLAAAVFNVGGGFVRKPFLELTGEEFAGGYDANGFVSHLQILINKMNNS